jgi:nicotinamide-nucleotide amidase
MKQENVTASIITIGDELLIGQTLDTNSAWMAQELNKAGIWVRRRVAVGDVRQEIWQALDEEIQQSDIVLLTGGLGPTADDITKPLLCDYFGGKMTVHAETLAHVKDIFENKLKRPLLERNLRQAEVPDNCTVLFNKRGTAPGMWFDVAATSSHSKRVVVSMPGVPHEMKGLISASVLPRLKAEWQVPHILHRTLLTAGAGESFLAERIQQWEEALPPHIKLAYLPNYGLVRLRLTTTGSKLPELQHELDYLFAELQEQVKDVLVINEDKPLEEALGQLLLQKGKTVATAESCTGGYIAHLITSIQGSSAYYEGSSISYSYTAKERMLQVHNSTLTTKGAVSQETVQEMLGGLLKQTGADYGIATSGIMGPGGGTPDKPVGTVWVAVGNNERMETHRFLFRFDRMRNIQLAAANALLLLFRFVQKDAS